jgi:hypothetical protein
VPKYTNSEPLETPASLAIVAVAAPSPWDAMTRVAADKIALRRFSLRALGMARLYKRVTSQSKLAMACRPRRPEASVPALHEADYVRGRLG